MIIAYGSQDSSACLRVLIEYIQEVKKLNTKLSGKDKSIKYLREKYEVNKVSDMMSQKSKFENPFNLRRK